MVTSSPELIHPSRHALAGDVPWCASRFITLGKPTAEGYALTPRPFRTTRAVLLLHRAEGCSDAVGFNGCLVQGEGATAPLLGRIPSTACAITRALVSSAGGSAGVRRACVIMACALIGGGVEHLPMLTDAFIIGAYAFDGSCAFVTVARADGIGSIPVTP